MNAIAHNLLDRFQPLFDTSEVSSILLGDQPAHPLLVLEPPPEPDPKHRQDDDAEDRLDQQRFLKGENVDDGSGHINLLTRTR